MKHILLVVGSDVAATETGLQCMKRIALSQEYTSSGAKDSTLVQIITTVAQVEELSDNSHSINDWLSLEETISMLARIEKQENAEECSVGSVMENVARGLHDAADSLPYLGSCVDIILCLGCPQAVAAGSSSVVPVAGALRRLTDWHNGHAIIVALSHELSSLERHLTELVHCQVINSVDELNLDWPVWRGKVAVMDHIENTGHLFHGCWLENLDWEALVQQKLLCLQQTNTDRNSGLDILSQTAVCGRTIEVLQEVDLRTFPLCLLDSWSLHLHAAEQHSVIFLKYIEDLQTTGLLARVRLYLNTNKIPLCGAMNLSTAAWKERVLSELENLQETTEEQVADDWLYLYLLLLPSQGASPVIAQVLLSPHEINTSILPLVEDQILVQKSVIKHNRNRCRIEIVACDELVLDQRDTFVMMLNILKENLQHVRSQHQDGVSRGSNAYEKMVGVAADIQRQIISAAFRECKSVRELLQDGTGYNIRWFTGSALDVSKFPEKLAIQATEATKKTLQSFPSMDSLTTSSPLSAADAEKKKDFNVYDVLEHFNQDGSLKEMTTCPVKSARLKGRGLCRLDRQCTTNLQWPESMLLKCHDIFYYSSEINWNLEKRYSKVRDRGYFPDTRSSFVSPIKKAQQTHSMLRRSASAQSPTTDSGPERPRRMSLKKASMADIFKQPASHLCSPRKQLQGTLKSATPELPLFAVSTSLEQLPSNSRAHSADLPNRSRDSFGTNKARNQTISPVMDISNQSPRKRTWELSKSGIACKRDRKSSSHDVEDLCPVRRSPRRSARPPGLNSDSPVYGSIMETPDPNQGQFGEFRNPSFEQQRVKEASLGSAASEQTSAKMKRSDRHKLKLQRIIDHVLREKGVQEKDRIFAACSRNLFNVSMVLLKTLTSSQNLTEEMKTVVYGQVTQIINLEKRRCGMAL